MRKIMFMVAFLSLMGMQAFAQTTVTGTVIDPNGEPVPGATVRAKGFSDVGTITDLNGSYSLSVPDEATTLIFTFVGMKTQEIEIGGQTEISVSFENEDVSIDEIIITGFTSRKKSETTGSSVQLDSDELSQVPVASIDQVLQGKVAGLSISGTSGTPGSEQNIRIRGVSSVTAGNEPLYVIDGVPIGDSDLKADDVSGSTFSALSTLNSANIQSVTILKDASATAPYGARGANGVIVITTKSGKHGKTRFNFSSNIGWANDAIEGPVMLTAAQQEELAYEGMMNDYGMTLEEAQAALLPDFSDWIDAGRPEGDWARHITNKDALTMDYSLSAAGGDEKSSFYVSLGYFTSEATVIGADFERLTGSLNYTRNLTSNLKLSTINTVSNTLQNGVLEQSAYYSSPRTAKYFANPRTSPYNEDGTLNTDNQTFTNPLYVVANDISETRFTRLMSNNTLTWNTPVKNLDFSTRAAIDVQLYNFKVYQNRIHGDGESTNGYAEVLNRNNSNVVFQNALDYLLELNDDNHFKFKIQHEYQKNEYYRLYAEGEQFAADGLSNLDNAGSPLSAESSFYDWKVSSFTGVVDYNYANRYVLNASFRKEGNSRFASDYRWGTFWSAGAAWNMHNESFMSDFSSVVSNLKFRTSYGVTGNANIGINQYQVMLGFDSNYAGSAAVYPAGYGNDLLTWETQATLDAGIDFGLFQNKIEGSFSYYYRTSSDLLLDVPLSRTTGFTSQTANIGTMWNKGIELELNFDIIRRNDFNISLGGYFATVENEVTELAKDTENNPRTITDRIHKVDEGHTVNEFFMVTFAGVDTETGVNTYYLNGIDGETTTNFSEAERAFQGTSALPTLTAGINLHVDFKGVFFDIYGYYAGGHQVYEGWHRYIHGSDAYNILYFNSINTVLDRWQEPGDITNVEKVTTGVKPWERHSNYLHDGDYFRIKNITLGYDINSSLLSKAKIASAKVFVRWINAFTWVKNKDLLYDPEVDATGETGLTTPPIKTLTFGLNINF